MEYQQHREDSLTEDLIRLMDDKFELIDKDNMEVDKRYKRIHKDKPKENKNKFNYSIDFIFALKIFKTIFVRFGCSSS